MKGFLVLILIVVTLAGCETRSVADAKKAVEDKLKDPESAQFKEITKTNTPDQPLICGKYNAKNAMGGYVGFRTFMYFKGRIYMSDDELSSIELSTCCMTLRGHFQYGGEQFPKAKVEQTCSKFNTTLW